MEKNILKKYKSFFNFVSNVKSQTDKEKNIQFSQNLYLKNISKSNYNVKNNTDQIYDNKLFLKYWVRKKRPGARN
ncbi:conserved Plasmodium protein, unknown function [Plasmodium malariae]|uniref:Uncharacterized protein n=1 Tax=Plasmodium malariae TaxID=5858 RepID=A0A1A8WEA6_PLAMA|nr:conserved Plasmodium protein, unknown function [Plasmodium malariae]SBS90379.1 conserved Plasmodium protein, unknown function [Plasmodium malariae]SCP03308.1 conserved Plasmodium protein, unknown function [Plasmodium malariae]